MPKITIANLFNKSIEALENQTIFTALQAESIDWMHACGTKGRCTTCKFVVAHGENNISPLTVFENKYLETNRLHKNERLACQSKAWGDITIVIPESGKMPHINYSN